VAKILGRSEHTVKNQMRNIYCKLGVRNRIDALQRTSQTTISEGMGTWHERAMSGLCPMMLTIRATLAV